MAHLSLIVGQVSRQCIYNYLLHLKVNDQDKYLISGHSMLSVAFWRLLYISYAKHHYVKELHRECHKIVISYVDIGVEYIYIKNIQL